MSNWLIYGANGHKHLLWNTMKERVYEFTGLDYWTGLLDWTTGLIKSVFSFVNTILRADTYIARLYSKCVDKAFREKSQDFICYMEDCCFKNQDASKARQ